MNGSQKYLTTGVVTLTLGVAALFSSCALVPPKRPEIMGQVEYFAQRNYQLEKIVKNTEISEVQRHKADSLLTINRTVLYGITDNDTYRNMTGQYKFDMFIYELKMEWSLKLGFAFSGSGITLGLMGIFRDPRNKLIR